MHEQLAEEARFFLRHSRSITPVGGKVPWMSPEHNGEATWDRYKRQPIDDATLARLCRNERTTGIALVCGAISGNIEVLDFDFKQGLLWFERWLELVGREAIAGLPIVETGGGGIQLAYECDEIAPRQILASYPSGNPKAPWLVMIETRGEGNLAVLPPSIHPETHRAYRYRTGHFADAPRISVELRALFHQAARALDQKGPAEAEKQAATARRRASRPRAPLWQQAERGSVIEAFNAQESVEDWLDLHGYTVHGSYAVRPDGKRRTVKIRDNRSFHNAASDPLADGHWKTPFELMLRHPSYGGGDFRRALEHASVTTGVRMMTFTVPAPYPPPPPPPPSPPIPIGDPSPGPVTPSAIVVVTDDEHGAERLRALGLPTIVTDRVGTHIAELQAALAPYAQRVVVLTPPDTGEAEALAADLGATFVELPTSLTDMVAEGATGLIDLISRLRAAFEPVYRLGHRLGRK